jgi:hypothetical protein
MLHHHFIAVEARENIAGSKTAGEIWKRIAIGGSDRWIADVASKLPVDGCVAKTKSAENNLRAENVKPAHSKNPECSPSVQTPTK